MKLLVIRFSALGDVAMSIPVISSLAARYPRLEITVLSRPFMQPLFAGLSSRIRFKGVDVSRYKGIGGLYRLFRQLETEEGKYDAVADLHDVLRSKVLRTFFRFSGSKVAHIDKGRKEKKALTRPRNKVLRQLPTSFTRYERVFGQLGYPVETAFRSIYGTEKGDCTLFQSVTGVPDGKRWIGIAPFATHPGKRLPETTVTQLIEKLSARKDTRIFLFGSGKEEWKQLETWADSRPNVLSMAGKLKLNGELALMSHLDVMVSMDSANMHLASLTGIPVVSVWGATHPFAGFMGWRQSIGNAVQAELPCRPCSIFGNKPCRRKDYACLTDITPESIVSRIERIINIIQ